MLCILFLICYLSSLACPELLNRHRRTWIIATFEIEEELTGPFPFELGTVNVERKYPIYFELHGEGVDEEPQGVLSIHKETGMLYVHKPVDFEQKKKLKLRFEARKQDFSVDTKLGIEIGILDVNDNAPQFQRDLYEIQVSEVTIQGTHLLSVQAYDKDESGSPNSAFHYEIKSATPNVPDTKFYISELGAVSFTGCLDREVAEKFIILVEAKDHGDVVSLSSTSTIVIHIMDGNNHLPVITGQTGRNEVKENECGISPLRLHTTDGDSVNSSSWRVNYIIGGDTGGHFEIKTDLETNDGILTIVKPLDFEEGPQRELLIAVENQEPFVSCKVKEKHSSGLWDVDISKSPDPNFIQVLINIEDTNDPPKFKVASQNAKMEENSPAGTWVEKVDAVDPDAVLKRDFVYKVGNDPAGWLTIDPDTGDISTVKTPDRESPHVTNSFYTVTMHAVDDDTPPLTGTTTIHIHMGDQNDNYPQLLMDNVNICLSNNRTLTPIRAFDLDEHPFGGPFKFEILGNFHGKWELDSPFGFTVGLVKEPGVYAGVHIIDLKISDLQGVFAISSLSVFVCECSTTSDCSSRHTAIKSFNAAGVALGALVLFLALLFATFIFTWRKTFLTVQSNQPCEEIIQESNIEKPGTDCEISKGILDGKHKLSHIHTHQDGTKNSERSKQSNYYNISWKNRSYRYKTSQTPRFRMDTELNYQCVQTDILTNFSNKPFRCKTDTPLPSLIQKRVSLLQEVELLPNYDPHIYKEEGDLDTISELDAITMSDDDTSDIFKQHEDFDMRFKSLACSCMHYTNRNEFP